MQDAYARRVGRNFSGVNTWVVRLHECVKCQWLLNTALPWRNGSEPKWPTTTASVWILACLATTRRECVVVGYEWAHGVCPLQRDWGHYRTPNYPHCWSFYITITIIVLKEGQPLSMTGLFVTLWWWFIPDNGLSNIVPHKPNQALLRLIRHRHIHTLTHKHRTNNGLFMRLREMWFVDWAMCCFCPLNHPPPLFVMITVQRLCCVHLSTSAHSRIDLCAITNWS